jgi:hypothetical protein
MKPVFVVAALLFFFATVHVARAQSLPDSADDQPIAESLIEHMLSAEKSLSISGEQVTTLYRPERTFSASQKIEQVGDWDLRLDFFSPSPVDGDIFIDNGRIAWHYIPAAHRLEVGISDLEKRREESAEILRKLDDHELTAQVIGQDVIAGQNVGIVQVNAEGSWGEHRYWIDPNTGAQLKIQTFGDFGQKVSETYFTKISFPNNINRTDFDPPKVGPDVATVPMIPRGSKLVSGIPTSVDCGFIPLTPSYIPPGFAFESSLIMPVDGQNVLGLTYQNALVTLSIFEMPIITKPGGPIRPNEFRLPHQGVLTAHFNGYRYIVIANLPDDIMQQIVQSMH